MVTGESMPVTKAVGDKGIGGTLNQTDGFIMRAERAGRAIPCSPGSSTFSAPEAERRFNASRIRFQDSSSRL